MSKQDLSKLMEGISSKFKENCIEDLQYNLSTFLNEDIYLDDFDSKDTSSLFWINFFVKNKLIFISKEEQRILLLPAGESLLIEINYLLFYMD